MNDFQSRDQVVLLIDRAYLATDFPKHAGSHSELLPFFGEPALTTTTTSKLKNYMRVAPEQYACTYRRFKDRPEPYFHFY